MHASFKKAQKGNEMISSLLIKPGQAAVSQYLVMVESFLFALHVSSDDYHAMAILDDRMHLMRCSRSLNQCPTGSDAPA